MLRQTSALLLALLASSARADDSERIAALERRVAELETRALDAEARARDAEAHTTRSEELSRAGESRVTLGASARFGWYDGGEFGTADDFGARVADARFFLDAELAEDVRIGNHPLVRNIGFSFEWNLVRRGDLFNDVGELYVDLQGIAGSSWLNLRPGRFQIPVGEAYKRYSRGTTSNPFITQPLGGPWWWDEGVMLYGGSEDGRFGYVASVANGETPLSFDAGDGAQGTLKLWTQPREWLYLSASGLTQGEIGSGGGALWLGETWATPVGVMSSLPSWIDGVPEPPSFAAFDSAWLAGADVVLTPNENVRGWIGGGHYALDSRDAHRYDRALHYWIAELVLRGGLIAPELAPAWLGLRADEIGTDDDGRGYLLAIDYVDRLGYNMRRFRAYSAVLGWRLGNATSLRAEYSFRDIDLVRGVPAGLRDDAHDADVFGVEIGVGF
ncbi:MAG TPA: hypothetical protein VII78_06675 [Myxococcota bacterium]|jgi:hypothetical protein